MVHKEYYDILGVSVTASQDEIKKGYRKKALEHHPDKGGDQEKFKLISKVYQILSDDNKKKQYDRCGENGMEIDNNFNPNDMFQSMFSHVFNQQRYTHNNKQTRDTNMIYKLELSLEQLYNGINKLLNITTDRLCSECKGNGCIGPIPKCDDCNGTGQKTIIKQMGPLMIQQSCTCQRCHGKGNFITDTIRCTVCNGNCIIKQKSSCQIVIPPGSSHGQQLTLKGAGNHYPNTLPGNVIISVSQKKHELFERQEHNLLYHHTINLKEALCGFNLTIKHLDNQLLHIKHIFISTPESKKILQNKGMSICNSNNFGDLIIQLHIHYNKLDDLTCIDKHELSNIFNRIYPDNYLNNNNESDIHFIK
jgi:DnaJ family protein A protein 2